MPPPVRCCLRVAQPRRVAARCGRAATSARNTRRTDSASGCTKDREKAITIVVNAANEARRRAAIAGVTEGPEGAANKNNKGCRVDTDAYVEDGPHQGERPAP